MRTNFDNIIEQLMMEAQQAPPMPPDENDEDQNNSALEGQEGGDDASLEDVAGDMSDDELLGGVDEIDEPASPEEMELAKLAVRALNFNIQSKDLHQFSLKSEGELIPFEKISDFLESTKKFRPVLAFVEFVMNKFEGIASKWAEQPEIKGKSIIQKLDTLDQTLPEEERLDDAKKLYWTRIILNALLRGGPDFNLVISDVNEDNIKEIFSLLKMHFGTSDTRGMLPNKQFKAPGVF